MFANYTGMILLVLAIFFWAKWELGAIEAISLSILVGSSVDYLVHIVEGYLLAGQNPPESAMKVSKHRLSSHDYGLLSYLH